MNDRDRMSFVVKMCRTNCVVFALTIYIRTIVLTLMSQSILSELPGMVHAAVVLVGGVVGLLWICKTNTTERWLTQNWSQHRTWILRSGFALAFGSAWNFLNWNLNTVLSFTLSHCQQPLQFRSFALFFFLYFFRSLSSWNFVLDSRISPLSHSLWIYFVSLLIFGFNWAHETQTHTYNVVVFVSRWNGWKRHKRTIEIKKKNKIRELNPLTKIKAKNVVWKR